MNDVASENKTPPVIFDLMGTLVDDADIQANPRPGALWLLDQVRADGTEISLVTDGNARVFDIISGVQTWLADVFGPDGLNVFYGHGRAERVALAVGMGARLVDNLELDELTDLERQRELSPLYQDWGQVLELLPKLYIDAKSQPNDPTPETWAHRVLQVIRV